MLHLRRKLNDRLACILHGLELRSITEPPQTAPRPGDLLALRKAGMSAVGGLACLAALNLTVDLVSRSPYSVVALALLSCVLLGATAWVGWLGWRAHAHWGEFREYQRQVGLVFGIDLEQLMGVEDVWYLGAIFDQSAGVITCSSFPLSHSGARMQLGNRKFPWDSDLPVADIRAGMARLKEDPRRAGAVPYPVWVYGPAGAGNA